MSSSVLAMHPLWAQATGGPPDEREPSGGVGLDGASVESAYVAQARAGHVDAFDALVQLYSTRIYAHVYRMMRNREEAEDVAQETFLRAYRHLHRFDTSRPFRAWLYAIATRVALNALRSKRRQEARVAGGQAPSRPEEWERSAVCEPGVFGRLESGEQRAMLGRALDQLPAAAAALVHLHYYEGYSLREAGEIVGITEGAAKVALHRARKRLRALLVDGVEDHG